MIVVSTDDRNFDFKSVRDCNALRDICSQLHIEVMTDLRPHGGEILMSRKGLTQICKQPEGLAFLSAFCGMERDMLIEFVLMYNPELEFRQSADPEVNEQVELLRDAIIAYRANRGAIN